MLTSDWHIHSRNSCDDACLVVEELMADAADLGIDEFGLTDHIHTPFNLPDLAASRREYLEAGPTPRFHFGVEVSVVSEWELAEIATGRYPNPVYGLRSGGPPGASLAIGLTAEDVAGFGIEFVVGGTHWPMYVPYERDTIIRDYHRQNLFLAQHPLVTIVAHPWWWMGHWRGTDGLYRAEPWFDDFQRHIPASMHDEFAAAVIETDKLVEINLSAHLLNRQYPERFKLQYLDYLAGLRQRGVRLCLGSDCHDRRYRQIDFATGARLLTTVGITDQDLWRLPPHA